MIVTYLGHSGFLIETEKLYLLFDSIAAEEITPRMQNHPFSYGIMPQLDPAKELLVFVSHAHQDHFSRRICKLRELYPHVTYFLSSDIDLAPLCEAGYISGPDDPAILVTGPGQAYHPVLMSGCDLLIYIFDYRRYALFIFAPFRTRHGNTSPFLSDFDR